MSARRGSSEPLRCIHSWSIHPALSRAPNTRRVAPFLYLILSAINSEPPMTSSPLQLPQRFLTQVRKSEHPPAVVLGTGTTGLTIAKALAKHKVPVIGLDDRKVSYTSRSAAFELLLVDDFYDVQVIDRLQELASILPRKAALFCSGDEHVLLLSKFGARIRDQYLFELPAPKNVETLMNKHLFAQVARAKGWPIPRTEYCETVEEVDRLAGELDYPVILKPQLKNREARTHSPQKTFRCSSSDELLANYRLLAQWEPEVVIQQWIPGGDEEIRFSFHYFDSNLEEVVSFEGKKVRQYLPECGSTSCAVGAPERRVTELSRQILTDLESVGFCSVEYKRDPRDGRFYIMEPTAGRVNLQVGVAVANNVDVISHGYFHLIGRHYADAAPPTHHVKWVLIPQDLLSAQFYVRRGDLTWAEYLRSVSGPKVLAPLDPADPKLLLAFASEWSGRIARGVGKRLQTKAKKVPG